MLYKLLYVIQVKASSLYHVKDSLITIQLMLLLIGLAPSYSQAVFVLDNTELMYSYTERDITIVIG